MADADIVTRKLTDLVMSSTALVLGAAGVATLFLPDAVGELLALEVGAEVTLQLVAAGLLAIATLNWMGRTAIYGGIFGRPIVVANLMFGTVSSLSLVSALIDGEAEPRLWGVAIILGLHALTFAYLLRTPPYRADESAAP